MIKKADIDELKKIFKKIKSGAIKISVFNQTLETSRIFVLKQRKMGVYLLMP